MRADTPRRILHVEDRPEDAELVRRILADLGKDHQIHLARDGAEAAAFVIGKNEPLDLVLLDLKLPRVNGHEVLRILKRTPRTAKVPVVVLTSSSEPADVAGAYANGANSYVVKPVKYDELCDVVSGLARYWLQVNQPGA
jgi:CheY-like chemotaxis protein